MAMSTKYVEILLYFLCISDDMNVLYELFCCLTIPYFAC